MAHMIQSSQIRMLFGSVGARSARALSKLPALLQGDTVRHELFLN